jgi:hypothetical protein
MLLESMLLRRGQITRSMLSFGRSSIGMIVFFIVAILGLSAAPGVQAEVAGTDQFTPRSWQPGASASRSSRITSRRTARVTATTSLEEFEVPRRATARRVVERKRQPRRVRVAALPRTTDALPQRTIKRRVAKATRVASLGAGAPVSTARRPTTSLTGGGIAWRASSACLAGNLRGVISAVATSYGSVTVNSTCRSRAHNRRVGGASRSWHLTGNAADFRVHGASVRSVLAFLRGMVGGVKHYGGGLFHIDNGPRRSF